MFWKTSFTKSLGLRYPIAQAPMLGVSTPEMAAIVSNEGGLGSLPVGGLSPEVTRQLIRKTKALTKKPFAVNLFVHDVPEHTDKELEPMRTFLLKLAKQRGYTLNTSDLSNFNFYTYHDQLQILAEENISIVSFTFGQLDDNSVAFFKSKGCTLMGTATCLEEALLLEKQKINMLVIQGLEAGGHRGSFLKDRALPQIGLFTLLPEIAKSVKVPCIAAGGINSAETMRAAFDLGAEAVQIGTAFIDTQESEAITSYKSRLTSSRDTDTVLTQAFSGRWARGIKNEMMRLIEESGITILPYPIQNSLTAKFRKLAQQNNDAEYTNLWSGQSVVKREIKQTKEVFLKLVEGFENLA